MKATIIIDKMQALLDGIDAEGARIIDFAPDLLNKEQRECLTRCKTDKNGSFEVNPNDWDNDLQGSWCNKMPKVSSADVYTLATLLDSRIALEQQIAAKKVKKDTEKVMAYAALKDEAFYTVPSYYNGPKFYEVITGELLPVAKRIGHQETLDRIERIKTEIFPVEKAAFDAKKEAEKQAVLAREAKVSHDGEARKKAKAEKAAREKDQIEKWVSENAPDEMKDRFAAGVLDRDEVLDANARSGLRMPWSSPECILGNANSVSRKPKEPGSWSGLLSGSSSFPVSIGYRNKEALYGHRIPNN